MPGLAALPRVALGTYPTPVERIAIPGHRADLWIKRDDLGTEILGGNKVRSLEVLLGGVRAGEHVGTLGPRGSTHSLATAVHARRLGARVSVIAWPQPRTPEAEAIWRSTSSLADARAVPLAVAPLAALWLRLRCDRWIPIGGSSAAGTLGHVSAALELAEQIAADAIPEVTRIVVAFGSGGTAAGLALGAAMAGLRAEIVAVRVGPRFASNARRIRSLAAGAAKLIRNAGGSASTDGLRFRIVHAFYGGEYGRATAAGNAATATLASAHGLRLDPTYTAKAFAGALAESGSGPTLFWNTFDARAMMNNG